MRVRISTVAALFAAIATALGQQDTQFTQYMYNTMAINPAYAGTQDAFVITPLYRAQWTGIEGAPTTQSINAHAPLTERLGAGLSVVHDDIGNGTSQETNFYAAASYAIPVDGNGNKLVFGLNAGGQLFNVDFQRLQNYNPALGGTEPNIDRNFSPNFGAGAYWYNSNYYLGVSVPSFLETEHFDGSATGSSAVSSERLGVYLMGGYVMDVAYNLKFKPAFLLRSVSGSPLQADLSANFLFKERFTFGAAYRWDAAVSMLVGFDLTEHLMLGFAYDRDTNNLADIAGNQGSYEILLRIRLGRRSRGGVSGPLSGNPRFF